MPTRVANHSLQSPTYWIGRYRVPNMETSHLLNTLRFLLRHPLRQLAQSEVRYHWECAEAEEHGSVDWDLPNGGSNILRDARARSRFNEQVVILEEASPDALALFLDAVPAPATHEELVARADEWIRNTPTFAAIAEELMERLLKGYPLPDASFTTPDHDEITTNNEPF